MLQLTLLAAMLAGPHSAHPLQGTRAGMSRVSTCWLRSVSTGPKSATPPMSAAGTCAWWGGFRKFRGAGSRRQRAEGRITDELPASRQARAHRCACPARSCGATPAPPPRAPCGAWRHHWQTPAGRRGPGPPAPRRPAGERAVGWGSHTQQQRHDAAGGSAGAGAAAAIRCCTGMPAGCLGGLPACTHRLLRAPCHGFLDRLGRRGNLLLCRLDEALPLLRHPGCHALFLYDGSCRLSCNWVGGVGGLATSATKMLTRAELSRSAFPPCSPPCFGFRALRDTQHVSARPHRHPGGVGWRLGRHWHVCSRHGPGLGGAGGCHPAQNH